MRTLTFKPLLKGYYVIYIPNIKLRKKSEVSTAYQYNLNKQYNRRIASKYRTFSYDNN